MTALSTHVLDAAMGTPAAGVAVTVEGPGADGWSPSGTERTDADGRATLGDVGGGPCRLTFATGGPFFAEVALTVLVPEGAPKLHVPLLLAPYALTFYRGS